MRRRIYVFVVLAAFTVALTMRTIPLYWSPLTLSTPRGSTPETRCGDDLTDEPEVEL